MQLKGVSCNQQGPGFCYRAIGSPYAATSSTYGPSVPQVFGEGVKSARGETAILGRGDHTRNMFGTSLHRTDCKQTIALETAEIMQ